MSTNYTHFTNLAFDNLFARGPDGSESLIFSSSGLAVTTLNIGPSTVQTASTIYRDSTAGASTNSVELKVGNLNSTAGGTFLRYTNAGATSSPSTILLFQPRNNADTTSYTAGSLSFTKTAAADSATITLSSYNGSLLQTVLSVGATGAVSIRGTTTNDSASAGFVGEYIESVVSTATNFTSASGIFGNLTTISLTAGDWDVTGCFTLQNNGASLTGYSKGAVSKNSGNTTTDHILGSNELQGLVTSSGVDRCVAIPSYRISVASTTTVYLKLAITTVTSGTPQTLCRLSARRAR